MRGRCPGGEFYPDFDFFFDSAYAVSMIEPMPDKERYQLFMDHALPGHFVFVSDFTDDMEATKQAEKLHFEHTDVDVVVFDARKGTLRLTLAGRRTLTGRSI